jgi:signal transduction histidine kinase
MADSSDCFPLEQLDQIFPFHLRFDRALTLLQVGTVLQRMNPDLEPGSAIAKHFSLQRPAIALDFATIQPKLKSLFILKAECSDLHMKGQMVYLESSDTMLFLGSPQVHTSVELRNMGLTLKDYAIHDSMPDLLFLRQTSEKALDEARQLADQLTEQKTQLQEALTAQAELTHTAEAQARELSQAIQALQQAHVQLIRSEKMSSLGQMMAGIAHEINNPVGFLIGNLQPAQDYVSDLFGLLDLYQKTLPEPGEAIAEEIEAIDLDYLRDDLPRLLKSMKLGTERIQSISKSLRVLARDDQAHPSWFDVHDGIDSTLLILKHRLQGNAHRPAIEVVKDYDVLPTIECFPGQLNQVFMNLLANAIDAIDESHQICKAEDKPTAIGQITIRTEQPAPEHITIHIIDNGLGMTETVKQKLFDHLFTTKPVGKGTGLGLSITHQIVVDAHHGDIQVYSEYGKGTEFVVELPIKVSAPRAITTQ